MCSWKSWLRQGTFWAGTCFGVSSNMILAISGRFHRCSSGSGPLNLASCAFLIRGPHFWLECHDSAGYKLLHQSRVHLMSWFIFSHCRLPYWSYNQMCNFLSFMHQNLFWRPSSARTHGGAYSASRPLAEFFGKGRGGNGKRGREERERRRKGAGDGKEGRS